MLSDLGLPKTFRLQKEGRRIFVFKEGYEEIVRSAESGITAVKIPSPLPVLGEAEGMGEGKEGESPCLGGGTERREESNATIEKGMYAFGRPSTKSVALTGVKTAKGRGEYPCAPLEGGGTAIVRRVRHGGLWGKVMGDLLWGMDRPVQELINTSKALERGVPTAEILGVRLEVVWPLPMVTFYRAEVFSKELPETVDLVEFLESLTSDRALSLHKREIIRAVALAVRAMHDGGLYHNDLHLKNILVSRCTPFKAYIIDLDKSSLYGSLSVNQRMKNLSRLDRSVEKFMAVGAYCDTPLLITQRDKLRFLRDYFNRNSDWKDLARSFVKSASGGHTLHRWWWKVLGAMGIDVYRLTRSQPEARG